VPEDEVDRIFQALSDGTRRDILGRCMRHGESVSGLARQYDMSFAAVQKHVAVLARADLVTKQRRGRELVVHGNASTVRKAKALLGAYEQLWAERTTTTPHGWRRIEALDKPAYSSEPFVYY